MSANVITSRYNLQWLMSISLDWDQHCASLTICIMNASLILEILKPSILEIEAVADSFANECRMPMIQQSGTYYRMVAVSSRIGACMPEKICSHPSDILISVAV